MKILLVIHYFAFFLSPCYPHNLHSAQLYAVHFFNTFPVATQKWTKGSMNLIIAW